MKKLDRFISIAFLTALFLLMLSILFIALGRKMGIPALNNQAIDNELSLSAYIDPFENINEYYAEIQIEDEYPFDEVEGSRTTSSLLSSYLNKIESLTNSIDYYTSNFFPGYDQCIKSKIYYRDLINWTAVDAETTDNSISKMYNGYLTYIEPKVSEKDLDELADMIQDFSISLNDKNIQFLYISVGSKVDPSNPQLSGTAKINEHSNENGDNLLLKLNERNIVTYDTRALMKSDNLDWYTMFYKTDHHWTTNAGLWCAKTIASILNDNYGYSFDLDLFDDDSYKFSTYDDLWMGGQARALKYINCQKESFTQITPKFDTDITVNLPTEGIMRRGKYEDVVISSSRIASFSNSNSNDVFETGDPYSCIGIHNQPVGSYINNLPNSNSNKKILIIQDSFGWYSASFLACDIDQVDIIYPCDFNGSIQSYITETKPDTVIFMGSLYNINPINWNEHTSFFDLR